MGRVNSEDSCIMNLTKAVYLQNNPRVCQMQEARSNTINHRSEQRHSSIDALGETFWSYDATSILAKLLIKNHPTIVTDISEHGACLATAVKPAKGKHVNVRLHFKDFSPITVRGRVRYINEVIVSEKTRQETIGNTKVQLFKVGLHLEGNDNRVHEQLGLLVTNIEQ